MSQRDDLVKEQVAFLSRTPEQLRAMRGRELYDTLAGLDLTHGQYFRALDTTLDDYCAREFGVDLQRITVERFFLSDPNAKWLFPEVVREAVAAGMRQTPRYPGLIARDERINGAVYDVPYVNESPGEEELRQVAEGAAIPESVIRYGDRVVRLDKKGRGVIASYEVIRRMSVDMLRIHLRRMGERLGRNLDARLATCWRTATVRAPPRRRPWRRRRRAPGVTATWSTATCSCCWATVSPRRTCWPGPRRPRPS